MNEGSAKQNIVDNIKKVDTILVTVSTNPSVDELSAALALTMFVNDLNKHATAVVSGALPPAIHFLEPEKTFENTIDSLRDFVIALDKEKADHLRYKVEGDVVKIFITPYKTIITSDDLEYSQGDYNVEMIIALGVKAKENLDTALAAHGRILHDAIVATIGLESSQLGTVDYSDSKASSMSELAARVILALSDKEHSMSEQVASALLTGIVAATDRFSNDRTSSEVMSTAAKLMAAGANQQLIASKLREGGKTPMVDNQASEKIEKESNNNSRNRKRRGNKNRGLSIEHGPGDSPDESQAQAPIEPGNNSELPPVGATLEDTLQQSAMEQPEQVDPTPVDTSAPEAESSNDESPAEEPSTAPSSEPMSAEALLDSALSGAATPPVESPSIDLAAQLEEASAEAASQEGSQSGIDKAIEDATENPLSTAQVAATPGNRPSFGGVLNATTEQAADDKRRMEEADRNRTILSHDRPSQSNGEMTLGSPPINGAGHDEEQKMFNPLVEPEKEPELPPVGPTPPVESSSEPTLAELDRQNREPSLGVTPPVTPLDSPQPFVQPQQPSFDTPASSALDAVQAAYEAVPIQTPEPIVTPAMQAVRDLSPPPMNMPEPPVTDLAASIPTPPPPPTPDFGGNPMFAEQGVPVPDFSQLPTPPTVPDMTMPGVPTLPPDNLGAILPPAQNIPTPPQGPSDPGAFRIPGQ